MKKKSWKIILIVSVSVLTVALAVGIPLGMKKYKTSTKYYINCLNDGFNGELHFAAAKPIKTPDGFVELSGDYNGVTYISEDGLTYFGLSGYPDDSNNYHVTYFFTTNQKYELWGISVGDNISAAEEELINHGYVLDHTRYTLDVITIEFLEEEDIIKRIVIRLHSTNKYAIMID